MIWAGWLVVGMAAELALTFVVVLIVDAADRRAGRRRPGYIGIGAAVAEASSNFPAPKRIEVYIDESALRRCNPARKLHYHGAGDRCECGEQPNARPS